MALLKELIELGFSPMMALVLVVVVVMWGSLITLLGLFWRFFRNESKARDRMRAKHQAETGKRLEDCESDREELRRDLGIVKEKVARLTACQKKDCPMRLP